MTNEQEKAKELAKLLNAFAGGKQLQYQSEQFVWCGASSLAYIADSVINGKRPIRIKPETKRIPLTQQDLIDRELSGKVMRIKHGISCMLIQDFNDELVFFSDDEIDYYLLMTYGIFLDGTPCYKEVESE